MSPTVTLYVKDHDDPIWRRAKAFAAKHGLSLSEVVTDALRTHIQPSDRRSDVLTLLTAAVKAERRRRADEKKSLRFGFARVSVKKKLDAVARKAAKTIE